MTVHFHAPSQSLLMLAKPVDVSKIMATMPADTLEHAAYNLRVKHTEAATKQLRTMGYAAPSPFIAYYKFPKFKGLYDPFDHQRFTSEFLTLHRRCFCLNEMGAGKTASALWAADYLMLTKKVRKAVILSPLSTLERVWQLGVFETLMHRTCVIVHGSREKRLAALNANVDFYIINHDGLTIDVLQKELCKRGDIDLVIVDEGSKFRNPQTDKWKALRKFIATPTEKRLWWLTGTPAPNGPDDVWAQCKLVSPERVPAYLGQWRTQTMMEVAPHVWKPRDGGFKAAWDAMQPAVRFTKAECLDLPPCTTVDWDCELTPDQRKLVKDMAKDMKGEISAGVEIKAANAADRLNKLRQILLGSVKQGDDYLTIDCAPRTKLVRDVIEMASTKAIIVVPFKGALRHLEQEISKYTTCAVVNGDVAVAKRNAIFRDFSYAEHPRVLLCHPTVMSHGLTLTSANVLAFYGPLFSNDEYRQVVERINRPGQTEHMTVVRIAAHPIEQTIYKMLDSRELGQTSILSLYNDFAATAGAI